jgi:hypothetical protein
VLGVRIRQNQQKRQSEFYTLPRAKTSHFSEKSSEKRLKTPWVKVQVHRICQSPFWHLFVTPLKMGAKSPEVVETSGLFALISFLVQLDGKQHPFRSLDLKSPEISRVFAFPASQSNLVSRAE